MSCQIDKGVIMRNKKETRKSLIEYFSSCKTILDLQEKIQDLIGESYYIYLKPTRILLVHDDTNKILGLSETKLTDI